MLWWRLRHNTGYSKPLELVTTMDEDTNISPSLPTVAGNSGAQGFTGRVICDA
jgi:hypothetical protein